MKKQRVVLSFPPSSVEEPISYRLITEYGLRLNILRATIDIGKQGTAVLEIAGEEAQLAAGFNYLENLGVGIEPLSRDVQHLTERCVSCTACVPICPTEAFSVSRETDWEVTFDHEACVACLACVDACPYDAIAISLT